jgi:hypothetical protein
MEKHNFYLIKFSNGLVKVGIGNVPSRIATHKSTASIFDVHLEKEFSAHVENPRLVEQYMIKHLGANCSGIRAKEWFKDADYDNALAYFETIKDAAEFAAKPIKSAEAIIVDVFQHFCDEATATDLKKRIEHFEDIVLLKFPEAYKTEIYTLVKQSEFNNYALVLSFFFLKMKNDDRFTSEFISEWLSIVITELTDKDNGCMPEVIGQVLKFAETGDAQIVRF